LLLLVILRQYQFDSTTQLLLCNTIIFVSLCMLDFFVLMFFN
jgi:hypothetical protein